MSVHMITQIFQWKTMKIILKLKYEFLICATVTNCSIRTPAFGKGCYIQDIPQKVAQIYCQINHVLPSNFTLKSKHLVVISLQSGWDWLEKWLEKCYSQISNQHLMNPQIQIMMKIMEVDITLRQIHKGNIIKMIKMWTNIHEKYLDKS